jgi:hypothetical protein
MNTKSIQDNMQTEASVLDASFLTKFLEVLSSREYINPVNALETAHREFAKYGASFVYPTVIDIGNHTFPVSVSGVRYSPSAQGHTKSFISHSSANEPVKKQDCHKLSVKIEKHNGLYRVRMKSERE